MKPRMLRLTATLLALASIGLSGCFSQHSVQVAPIHVAPIRVTMDVNVHVQEGPVPEPEATDPASEPQAPGPADASPREPAPTLARP
jgi:hypothetical protein